jgi:hypothetical protein
MSDQVINVLKSWLAVFLSAVITAALTSLATDVWDWRTILFAGLVAVLPVIRNWLNANDTRYGKGYVPTQP